METDLLEPVVDAGIRLTNFFNGRVLTAEDLRREQDALRERHRGLASAIGAGVVRGLEVTLTDGSLPTPTVQVKAGLAFNHDGDPVMLARDVVLRLIPAAAEQAGAAGVFGLCETPAVQVEISNPGFYLLVARPASALSGDRVAAVDLASEGVGTRCGSRYSEEGVSFSLVSVPFPTATPDAPLVQELITLAASIATDVESARRLTTPDPTLELELAKKLSKIRNGMAYWWAGHGSPGERIRALAVPFPGAATPALSPLESMRAAGLLPSSDVPLALVYVTRRRLEWVDMWTARRYPLPRLGPDPVSLVNEDRLRNDNSALVLQFRDHASMFLPVGGPAPAHTVLARDWFLFLPPVGILPMPFGSSPGFAPNVFFGTTYGFFMPAPLQKPLAEVLFRAAMEDVPVRLQGSYYLSLYRFATLPDETTNWQDRYVMFRMYHGFPGYAFPAGP